MAVLTRTHVMNEVRCRDADLYADMEGLDEATTS